MSFNVNNVEFKEEQSKYLIVMKADIVRSKLLKAVFSFHVHSEIFNALRLVLTNNLSTSDNEDNSISLIKKVIETYPPIIQIIPKNQQ